MSKPDGTPPRRGIWLSVWITTVLAVSAVMFLGFRLLLGLGEADTDLYESPLILSVARQLIAGPGELYGPFGGDNPLVLIHAPLYYRVAALTAWPMTRAGLHPVEAARLAGRLLSVLGLLATLAAAYRLACQDGGSRRAGWWAVLLIAAAPVLAGQPFTVRPDMVGLALQSWGVVLVLAALEKPATAGRRLVWAYTAFGLAVCVKQHLVTAGAVSTLVSLLAWRRGQIRNDAIVRGLASAALVASVVYGLEWVVTAGRTWDAAFVAAGGVGRVRPGDWLHVGTVAAAVVGKSAGIIALLATAVLAAVRAPSAAGRWALAAGYLVVVSIGVFSVVQHTVTGPWVAGSLLAVELAALILVIPVGAVMAPRSRADRRLDSILWVYGAVEVVIVVILSRLSMGAWINYAIQGVIFAAVLTARTLVRALEGFSSTRLTLSASVAVVAALGSAGVDTRVAASRRLDDRTALAQIFEYARQPPSAIYFADRPDLNRLDGRLDLVFDDWLYPVFESLHLAESRSRWLRPQLVAGPIRVVVIPSDSPRLDGIPETLPELGYLTVVQFGRFRVWTR